jgi:hypothetical protein
VCGGSQAPKDLGLRVYVAYQRKLSTTSQGLKLEVPNWRVESQKTIEERQNKKQNLLLLEGINQV